MDKANYTDNGKGRYPLSTDGLEFIQSQIELIYNVAELHGRNYILKGSTAMTEGIIVVEGEMMPLQGQPNAYIQVKEEYDKLEADGLVFEKARVKRVAQYIASSTGEGCYEASLFKKLTTIEEMTTHLMPKGAIVMWSGAIEAIPAGWELCDGKNDTPNLSGRFIVGYDLSDDDYKKIGNDGGEKEVTLETSQCAMPSHKHSVSVDACIENDLGYGSPSRVNGNNLGRFRKVSKSYTTSSASTTAKPHENRPPYYVLAYIMKVV